MRTCIRTKPRNWLKFWHDFYCYYFRDMIDWEWFNKSPLKHRQEIFTSSKLRSFEPASFLLHLEGGRISNSEVAPPSTAVTGWQFQAKIPVSGEETTTLTQKNNVSLKKLLRVRETTLYSVGDYEVYAIKIKSFLFLYSKLDHTAKCLKISEPAS